MMQRLTPGTAEQQTDDYTRILTNIQHSIYRFSLLAT